MKTPTVIDLNFTYKKTKLYPEYGDKLLTRLR